MSRTSSVTLSSETENCTDYVKKRPTTIYTLHTYNIVMYLYIKNFKCHLEEVRNNMYH